VKWSHEPARAEDVPGAIERTYHLAMSPPRGPVFVSIPMDDWEKAAIPRLARHVLSRSQPDHDALAEAAAVLTEATSPALVVGGAVDRAGGWDAAVELAERLNGPVWEAPAMERASFPQDHPLYQGALPLAIKPLGERLRGCDVVLVVRVPIFRYYPHIPGEYLAEGTRLIQITDDPDEAARAPVGTSIVGDVASALRILNALVPHANRAKPEARPAPRAPHPSDPISIDFAMHAIANTLPAGTTIVEESASSRAAFYDQFCISRPASYFATASGGLGFALPGAVGAGLARPGTPVACIVGDGSAMFGIQAIWSAAQYDVPVAFFVLNNGGYGILKAFAAFQRTPGVPGLDLPGLDIVTIARGMGARAERIVAAAELPGACQRAFHEASTRRCPVLIDIAVDPEVGMLFGEPAPDTECG